MSATSLFGRSAQRIVRNRLGVPLLISALVIVVIANELSYQYSHGTLKRGIALTDARLQAAALLQAITDAELSAVSYVAAGERVDRERFAAKLKVLPEQLDRTMREIAVLDPLGRVPIDDVRRGVQRRQQTLAGWVELADGGQRSQALAAVASDLSQDAFETLRGDADEMLRQAAAVQSVARVNLYDAMSINRGLIHLLTIGSALGLLLFAWQLRRSDEAERVAKLELEQAVEQRTGELRGLARHLVNTREDERARVARELHDELGGLLTAMKLEFARLRRSPDLPQPALPRVAAIESRLNEGIALKRRIVEHLRPSALDQLGLVPSLDLLCRDQAALLEVPVDAQLEAVPLARDAQLSVYRLVQEALTNIGKYASATQVQVGLRRDGGLARAWVQDDGVGFDPATVAHGHHGLAGMRFRIESHGGRLELTSSEGRGARVEAWLPLLPPGAEGDAGDDEGRDDLDALLAAVTGPGALPGATSGAT